MYGQTAGARAQALQAQAEAQSRLAELLQSRVELGRATASEAAAARIATQRSLAATADAAAQSIAARARLATALGVPATALTGKQFAAPTSVPLTVETLASARRESLQTRSDVLAALAKIQSIRTTLDLEVAKQKPDVHLGPGYQWDQGKDKWSLAITFELPVFNRNEGPIAEALARHAEASAQLVAVQAAAISAIDAAALARDAADTQAARARQVREAVSAQVARSEARLALGAADQLERSSALLELAAAELAERDAAAAAELAAGQLEDALQLPFPHLAALADAARPALSRTP